ncbi:MAG TPA: hypothetical protein VMV81_14180 [Phycisphaerae bacterium]|nr:hypothetical protein [Phycisphaerae bacterium]
MIRYRRCDGRRWRGIAVVGFVAALLVIGTLALWLFQLTAAGNTVAAGHFYSTGALYAAESGIEMSLRELNQTPPTDIDSDGTIGTISNDGNSADDPQLGTGAYYVIQTGSSPATYRAIGRPVVTMNPWSGFRRTLEIQTQ